MTKDEVARKNEQEMALNEYGDSEYITIPIWVLNSMEEFAKQQAIAFADHLQFNYQPCAETGYWYDHHNDPHQHWRKSSQTIYNQFIEQQNKP